MGGRGMIEKGDTVITRGGFVGTVVRLAPGTGTAWVWFDWKNNVNRVEPYKASTLRLATREELEQAA
jgi:preprotein translocase subunit YajC